MKTKLKFLTVKTKTAMKKTIVMFSLFLLAAAGSVFAQGKVSMQDFHFFKTIQAKEGNNTVQMDKEGTLRFVLRNGQIMNVMHQDPAGKIIRIAENTDPAEHNPTPNPTCTGNLRCVKNEEANTMVCFCTPDVISSGANPEVQLTVQFTKLAKSTRVVIR